MDELLGTVLILVLTGFIADINSGTIVGSVFSARSGFGPGFAFLGGATAVRLVQGLLGLGILYMREVIGKGGQLRCREAQGP